MATLSFKPARKIVWDDAVSNIISFSTKISSWYSTFRENRVKSNLAKSRTTDRRLKDAAVQAPSRELWGCISNNAGAALPGTSGGAHRLGEARRAHPVWKSGHPARAWLLAARFKTLHVWNISPRNRGALAARLAELKSRLSDVFFVELHSRDGESFPRSCASNT